MQDPNITKWHQDSNSEQQAISTGRWYYLQCALLPSLLIGAFQNLPIDPQPKDLTGDLILVCHRVTLYLQFGELRQGEVRGIRVLCRTHCAVNGGWLG